MGNQEKTFFTILSQVELALRGMSQEPTMKYEHFAATSSFTMSSIQMSREDYSTADPAVCATYLKALGDPVRLQIVGALQSGPMSVSDLVLLLELEMANVSHHLRVLFTLA